MKAVGIEVARPFVEQRRDQISGAGLADRILDGTADVREGTRAFAENREANFSCQ